MHRILSLDLARGFTVLMIAPVHAVLVYSKPEVHATIMGKILQVIAEGPGAPLFMLIMGINVTLSRRQTSSSVFKRSATLLVAGFALNTVKFIIPLSFGMLPAALCRDLMVEQPYQLTLIGDILHFASIALLALHFIKRLNNYHYVSAILAMLICFLAPLFWDLHSANPLIDYILALTGGAPPKIFFPLFPWLVYPLAGMTIGYYLKRNASDFFLLLSIVGCGLIIVGFCFNFQSDFYRTLPGATTLHLGVVLLTLSAWHQFSKLPSNYFFRLLTWSSRNITSIYIIQWIAVMWFIPVMGYGELGSFESFHAMVLITFITYYISFLIYEYRKTLRSDRHWHRPL